MDFRFVEQKSIFT